MALPGLALAVVSAHHHMNLSRFVHVDGSFPVALKAGLGAGTLPVGRAECTRRHSRAHVELSFALIISVDGKHVVRTELAVRGYVPRLRSFLQQVWLGRVQREAGVGQGQGPPHAPAAPLLVNIFLQAENFCEIERLPIFPKLVLPSHVLYVWALHEAVRAEINFAYSEHVCSHCEPIIGNSPSDPHRTASVLIARSDVEGPPFSSVSNHKRFRSRMIIIRRTLEALLNRKIPHYLDCLFRRITTFQTYSGQFIDAQKSAILLLFSLPILATSIGP